MPFRVMTPVQEQKSKMDSSVSPTFSSLGRSPSIVPPAYTTDDLLAARNQKYSRWVYLFRIAIAATTLATSIAVIACAGVSLHAYSESHSNGDWLLPLWPTHVDLRPTHTVLGCGITIAIMSIAYLAAAFAPMVSEENPPGDPHVLAKIYHRAQTSYTPSTFSLHSLLSYLLRLRYLPLSSHLSSPTISRQVHQTEALILGLVSGKALSLSRQQNSLRSAIKVWRLWTW